MEAKPAEKTSESSKDTNLLRPIKPTNCKELAKYINSLVDNNEKRYLAQKLLSWDYPCGEQYWQDGIRLLEIGDGDVCSAWIQKIYDSWQKDLSQPDWLRIAIIETALYFQCNQVNALSASGAVKIMDGMLDWLNSAEEKLGKIPDGADDALSGLLVMTSLLSQSLGTGVSQETFTKLHKKVYELDFINLAPLEKKYRKIKNKLVQKRDALNILSEKSKDPTCIRLKKEKQNQKKRASLIEEIKALEEEKKYLNKRQLRAMYLVRLLKANYHILEINRTNKQEYKDRFEAIKNLFDILSSVVTGTITLAGGSALLAGAIAAIPPSCGIAALALIPAVAGFSAALGIVGNQLVSTLKTGWDTAFNFYYLGRHTHPVNDLFAKRLELDNNFSLLEELVNRFLDEENQLKKSVQGEDSWHLIQFLKQTLIYTGGAKAIDAVNRNEVVSQLSKLLKVVYQEHSRKKSKLDEAICMETLFLSRILVSQDFRLPIISVPEQINNCEKWIEAYQRAGWLGEPDIQKENKYYQQLKDYLDLYEVKFQPKSTSKDNNRKNEEIKNQKVTPLSIFLPWDDWFEEDKGVEYLESAYKLYLQKAISIDELSKYFATALLKIKMKIEISRERLEKGEIPLLSSWGIETGRYLIGEITKEIKNRSAYMPSDSTVSYNNYPNSLINLIIADKNLSKDSDKFYVERIEIEKKITASLNQLLKDKQSIISKLSKRLLTYKIIGVRGIGKKTLVRHIFSTYHLPEDNIFTYRIWCLATDKQTLKTAYWELAEQLRLCGKSLIGDKNTEELLTSVIHWLESNPGWLIVYEDVNKYEDLQTYIPQKGGVLFLTSSKLEGGKTYIPGNKVEITPMLPQEGINFIINTWGNRSINWQEFAVDENAIKNLVKKVGGLPLILEQIAMFIANNHYSVEKYLADYDKTPREFLKSQAKVLNITLLKIKNDYPQKIQKIDTMLYVCAYLSSDYILLTLLECINKLGEEQRFDDNLMYQEKVTVDFRQEILNILQEYLIINFSSKEQSHCKIHPVWQQVLQLRCEEKKQEYLVWRKIYRAMVVYLNTLKKEISNDRNLDTASALVFWTYTNKLINHVKNKQKQDASITTKDEIKNYDILMSDLFDLLIELYTIYYSGVDVKTSDFSMMGQSKLLENTIPILAKVSDWPFVKKMIVRNMQHKAEKTGSWKDQSRINESCAYVLLSLSNKKIIVEAMRQAYNYELIKINKKLNKEKESLLYQLDEKSLITLLLVKAHYGLLLRTIGQYKESNELLIDCLNSLIKKYTEDDQIVIMVHRAIGCNYRDMGCYFESENYLKKALQYLEKHAPEHLVTIATMLDLSALYLIMPNQLEEGRRLYYYCVSKLLMLGQKERGFDELRKVGSDYKQGIQLFLRIMEEGHPVLEAYNKIRDIKPITPVSPAPSSSIIEGHEPLLFSTYEEWLYFINKQIKPLFLEKYKKDVRGIYFCQSKKHTSRVVIVTHPNDIKQLLFFQKSLLEVNKSIESCLHKHELVVKKCQETSYFCEQLARKLFYKYYSMQEKYDNHRLKEFLSLSFHQVTYQLSLTNNVEMKKEIVNQIRKEMIMSVNSWTLDDLLKLDKLQCVLKEVWRQYPFTLLIPLTVKKTFCLLSPKIMKKNLSSIEKFEALYSHNEEYSDNIYFKEKDIIIISPYLTHFHPAIWNEESHLFDPKRYGSDINFFYKNDIHNVHNCNYLPFGIGAEDEMVFEKHLSQAVMFVLAYLYYFYDVSLSIDKIQLARYTKKESQNFSIDEKDEFITNQEQIIDDILEMLNIFLSQKNIENPSRVKLEVEEENHKDKVDFTTLIMEQGIFSNSNKVAGNEIKDTIKDNKEDEGRHDKSHRGICSVM